MIPARPDPDAPDSERKVFAALEKQLPAAWTVFHSRRVVIPSAGRGPATECELDLEAWRRLVAANPVLEDLDPDAEALIVNRLAQPHVHAIAPLDDCYRLVGLIKATWEGISGGTEMEATVERFFDGLRDAAGVR